MSHDDAPIPLVTDEDHLARSPHRRPHIRLAGVIMLLGAIALCLFVLFAVTDGSSSRQIEAGQPVTVVIPKGATSSDVAKILEQQGVVRNSRVFEARLRLNNHGADFKAGRYRMRTGSAYDHIVRTLDKGPPAAPTWNLTIAEGMRTADVAQYIDAQRSKSEPGGTVRPSFTGAQYRAAVKALRPDPSLKAPAGTRSMEGLLFPATYELTDKTTAQQFVQMQQQAFRDRMAKVDLRQAAKKNLTPYEVVIIASMIEREVRVARERSLVSAVIYNRLKQRMPLGIDATIQYAADPEVWKQELRQSDLQRDTPYNSRLRTGLPPTPIAHPGEQSLRAAAAPADVDYLYYVLKPGDSGRHTFTASEDEFFAAQEKYLASQP